MAKLTSRIRTIAGALALSLMLALAASLVPPPASAQQVNPTTSSVKEQQLLDQLNTVRGRGTIPDTKSYTIEHPAGRDWRQFRTSTLLWIGGVAILGMIVLLAIFYLYRGQHPDRGRPQRPARAARFTAFERFVHWITAASFVVLAHHGAQRDVRPSDLCWQRRLRGVQHLVTMGEVRAQLYQLRLHRSACC